MSRSEANREANSGVMPIHRVSVLNLMTFHWMTAFMWRVYKQSHATIDTMWTCSHLESAQLNGRRLKRLWSEEVLSRSVHCASLGSVIARFARSLMCIALLLNLVNVVCTFLGPALLLRLILDYADSTQVNYLYAVGLSVALFLSENGRLATFMLMMHTGIILGSRVRAGLMYIMYDKLLRLRTLGHLSPGKLVNWYANDCQRVFELMHLLPMCLSGPAMLLAGTIYTVHYIGLWALIGALVILLYYPYQLVIYRLTLYIRRRAINVTDQRVRMMTEILTAIKLIKFYAWEQSFAAAVAAVRARERRLLQQAAYLQTLSIAFNPLMSVFAAICTFTALILTGHSLSVTQAFVVIGVYNITRMKVALIPLIVRVWVESLVAFRRTKDLLTMDELDTSGYELKPTSPGLAVQIVRGTFAWDVPLTSEQQALRHKYTERLKSAGCSARHRPGHNMATSRLRRSGVVADADCVDDAAAQDNDDDDMDATNVPPDPARLLFEAVLARDDSRDVLFDVNFTAAKGQLVGVCGSIGSGKTSLIAAILGHMRRHSGTLCVDGRVAYVPQQAWLLDTTVRDNVVFGQPLDEDKYNEVIDRCSLKHDINMWPASDLTEIGERGVTLSGGQKQRLSVARAMYSGRDIYLLDDPLSSVDAQVGRLMLQRCLLYLARDRLKTVIFVTHQIQYLSDCDVIYVLRDGRVLESGRHDDLMMTPHSHYANLINTYYSASGSDESSAGRKETELDESGIDMTTAEAEHDDDIVTLQERPSADPDGRVVVDCGGPDMAPVGQLAIPLREHAERGAVSLRTYMTYCKHAGSACLCVIVLLSFAVPVTCSAFADWWLSRWIVAMNNNDTALTGSRSINTSSSGLSSVRAGHEETSYYAMIYGLAAVAIVLAVGLRGLLFMTATLRASTRLHDRVFRRILRCPMSFFDATPIGRLLNNFSKDLDEVDSRLPYNMEDLLQSITIVWTCVVMIAISCPWLLLAFVPPAAVFVFLQCIARVVMREMKRVDNVTRSPLFSHVATSTHGLQTIHAYDKQQEFLTSMEQHVDVNTSAVLHFYFSMRWLAIRLDVLTTLLTFTVALVVTLGKHYIPQSYAAIILVYVTRLTGLLQYTIRVASETEARFTSVERILHYLHHVDEEAPAIIVDHRPAAGWPEYGAIDYDSLCLRYRPSLPLVLRQISCCIRAAEKVGIVGRTGSGKSSLVSALFRLTEPTAGSISIDDLDISSIGLDDLRSRLAIIPQDPVLFAGTVRYNLDPFDERSDDDVWSALDRCHIRPTIEKLAGGLQASVVENGDNFSVGQRQLVCLARALLRHSRILVLDEATAAIDAETDAMVHQTVGRLFADCTVLIIAHRINTVLNCQRVLVLDSGRVVEFDSPQNLLRDPNSQFSAMVRHSYRTNWSSTDYLPPGASPREPTSHSQHNNNNASH